MKFFVDGASVAEIRDCALNPLVSGFTTNPTLMRKAEVFSYVGFANEALASAGGKPISFEVIADDWPEMRRQAKLLARLSDTVFVKIPVTTTDGRPTLGLVKQLVMEGVKVNVTAVLTLEQITWAASTLASGHEGGIISVFAGRIADTGRDPVPYIEHAGRAVERYDDRTQVLWASPRELLNVRQARDAGADIITVPHAWLGKMNNFGRPLEEVSLETVKMFHHDAVLSGYAL